MKKVVALLLAVLLVSTGLSALGEAQGQVASVFFGGGTPLSIDPALNSSVNGSNILKLSHAGLMGYQLVDGVATLSPELAESFTKSDDGLTYVFTLREGLKWSDGTDFKASDFVASWERAGSADLGADYGFLFDIIAKTADGKQDVVADDAARTLTVKLANPTPYFLDLCGFPAFFPVRVDLAENTGAWATDPAKYVGMGPFRMTSYKVDDVITFEKNPNYWNAANVKLAGVSAYLSEDNTAIQTAYENGTAHFINSIDPTNFPYLQSKYPGELVFGPYIGTWYVLFNVHKDLSPTGKQLTVQEQSKARFALGELIDRKILVEQITQGGQVPATGFFPNSLGDGLNANVRVAEGYGTWYTGTDTASTENAAYTQDQADALKTLIDLGYAHTGTVETGDVVFTDIPAIDFAFNPSSANTLVIQYIQETWNTFGITATINTEAWATLQQKLKAGDAEAARMGWIADFNDCMNFLEIFISASGNNYPRLGRTLGDYTRASEVTKDAGMGAYWGLNGDQTWADAYDALVTKIKETADPADRAALCADAEKVLMATGAVAPMYFYTNPYMLKPNVKDVMILPNGDVLWQYASIQ